jgi:hypothetical protein
MSPKRWAKRKEPKPPPQDTNLFGPVSVPEHRAGSNGDLPPHQPHIPTSRAAAVSVRHKTGGRLDKVMALLRIEPRTDQALWEALKDDADDPGLATLTTVEALRWKLREEGKIRDSGRTRINPRSGRKAIVWEINPYPGTVDPGKRPSRAQLVARAERAEARAETAEARVRQLEASFMPHLEGH